MDNSETELRVDRKALAEIVSNQAVLNAVLEVTSRIGAAHETELVLDGLLERIGERIPAEYMAVMLARGNGAELEAAVSRGTARRLNTGIMRHVFAERTAIRQAAPSSILCAPLSAFDIDLGVIYIETSVPGLFELEHLHILIALAGAAALVLNNARYIALLEGENQRLREYAYIDQGIVGNSPAIREIRNFVGRVAGSDSTILILGESGTGKELVARSIHQNSRRSNGAFVAVNCAAIVDTLVESELFGHERGAFTGAITQKKGKVELADGGSLFLDEVGELSLKTQAALLRFLQEREFQRVGGTRTLRADVRVVAATNRNMQQWIEGGHFRHDLYYRLQVLEVRTPSLSEVREDIPLLVDHFLKRFRYIRVVAGISRKAMQALMGYDWPGNVRQLQNSIEHALVYGRSESIEFEDLPSSVTAPIFGAASSGFEDQVAHFKRGVVERALAATDGDFEAAAGKLKLSSSYLRRLSRELNIKLP